MLAVAPVANAAADPAVDLLERVFGEERFARGRARMAIDLGRMLADPHHWAALAEAALPWCLGQGRASALRPLP